MSDCSKILYARSGHAVPQIEVWWIDQTGALTGP